MRALRLEGHLQPLAVPASVSPGRVCVLPCSIAVALQLCHQVLLAAAGFRQLPGCQQFSAQGK